jgi:hypothetical protein
LPKEMAYYVYSLEEAMKWDEKVDLGTFFL